MIKEKTVFILGAGASKPYGYPTANDLRQDILSRKPPNFGMYVSDYFRSSFEFETLMDKYNRYIEILKDTPRGTSIDLHISRNPSHTYIGKMILYHKILVAEIDSRLSDNVPEDEDWYSHLFEEMTRDFIGPSKINISDNKISFITFNYDRSLENMLYTYLDKSFNDYENKDEIMSEIKAIKIYHIFGRIFGMDWENNRVKIPYKRSNLLKVDLTTFYHDILLIHEKKKLANIINEIKDEILSAKRIIFLGFGYRDDNMKLLDFPNILKPGQKVYGTALNYTENEIIRIKKEYFTKNNNEPNDIKLDNLNCKQLLRE